MTLARSYCDKRARYTTPPAARCKGEPPSVADDVDVEHLEIATYLNDGLTIVLRDGSMLTRTPRRERWVEIVEAGIA